ncbi:MAG: hypothetical protein LC797_01465, partial [Chloroflexi bacterium]|nr:hypothetical protein [Chloroflexota bacterium]
SMLTAGTAAILLAAVPAAVGRAQEGPAVVQAPASRGAPPIQSGDRVYTGDQSSNTVSVIDATTNTLLGTLALGNQQPGELLGPLYNRQIDVHGLGFSPDGSLLDAVNVTSNSVTIIETATNRVRGTVYLERAPHEGFFTPDGKQLWVAVRGQNYVSVIDTARFQEVDRIETTDGASMVAFSPDGRVAFVDSSRTAEVDAIDVASRRVIARIPVTSPFSPNILVSPDGNEVWLTHKDVGKTTVIDAHSFEVKEVLDTGPVTNHVNFVSRSDGDYAYVSVGGENAVKVVKRGSPAQIVGTVHVGATPHGLWPSADSSRLYVGIEDGDSVQVIDTAQDVVIATIPIGQAPQALVYVARGAVPGSAEGLGGQGVGLPVVKAPLRSPAGVESTRGTAVARRGSGVDQLSLDVQGLDPGVYRVFLTDRAQEPFGHSLPVTILRVGADGRGRAQAQLALFDQELDGTRIGHVVVTGGDGVVLSDGGADGLPGPLTATQPPLNLSIGDTTDVRGTAVGSDLLGNVRALAVEATGDGTGGSGEVRVFHRLAGTVIGVWNGQVTCLAQNGAGVTLTGTISVGEERAQGLNLTGRSFRTSVSDGSPATFRVEVAPPDAAFEPCSAPTTPNNTVTQGDLGVTGEQ